MKTVQELLRDSEWVHKKTISSFVGFSLRDRVKVFFRDGVWEILEKDAEGVWHELKEEIKK